MKRDSSASGSQKNKVFYVDNNMDGMSGSCRWCTVVDDIIEEAGVAIVGGETHVIQNLCDQVVPVLRRLPQAIYRFVEDPEVTRIGFGIA